MIAGKTLLFFDEIQECPEAIMALRFFKEEYPELHVIAAGSLLEFTLEELPTFGVGRIHSLFMYPMTFDEFLVANNEEGLISMRNESDSQHPWIQLSMRNSSSTSVSICWLVACQRVYLHGSRRTISIVAETYKKTSS